jgi:hypothetical protein
MIDPVEQTFRDLVLERYDNIDQVPTTDRSVLRALAMELSAEPLNPARIAALGGMVKPSRHASVAGATGHYDWSPLTKAELQTMDGFMKRCWVAGPAPDPETVAKADKESDDYIIERQATEIQSLQHRLMSARGNKKTCIQNLLNEIRYLRGELALRGGPAPRPEVVDIGPLPFTEPLSNVVPLRRDEDA